MQFKIKLPFEAIYIMYQMKQAGYDCYLVGGAVRDVMLNAIKDLDKNVNDTPQEITDFDFTTDATPQEIQQVFTNSFYSNEFGTVGIGYNRLIEELKQQKIDLPAKNIKSNLNQPTRQTRNLITRANISKIHQSLKNQIDQINQNSNQKQTPPPFEITTYRSEGTYQDHRKPKKIEWGSKIEDDLNRRDFTINAMALTLEHQELASIFSDRKIQQAKFNFNSDQYQLIDQHQGLKDLTQSLIRTVRNPDERFEEDALRMLRAIRFSAQLDMEIEPQTLRSIKTHSDLIKAISWERIRDELLKMLTTDRPDLAIRLLDQTDLLEHILPELIETKGVEQGGHHTTDVWTHTLDSVANCPSKDPIVRLATLLHDIGKPQTFEIKDGNITFYNHEIISSRIADKIGKRLKLSNQQRQRLFDLVRYHMFYYQPDHTDAAVRRLMKRIGLKNIDDILDVREADRLGSGTPRTSWRLEELKDRMIDQLNRPFDVTDLVINGQDLIDELNLKPGPIIGDILNKLMHQVLDKPELNQKDKLLALAKKIKQNNLEEN